MDYFKPLHLACGDESAVPNQQLVAIDKGVATASNGSIIVRMNLYQHSELTEESVEILDGKYIHREVWKEIHKCDTLLIEEFQIRCFKKGIERIFMYSFPDGTFWDPLEIINQVKPVNNVKVQYMNSQHIELIRKALDCDLLYFAFSGQLGHVTVFPDYHSKCFGIFLPEKSESGDYVRLNFDISGK